MAHWPRDPATRTLVSESLHYRRSDSELRQNGPGKRPLHIIWRHCPLWVLVCRGLSGSRYSTFCRASGLVGPARPAPTSESRSMVHFGLSRSSDAAGEWFFSPVRRGCARCNLKSLGSGHAIRWAELGMTNWMMR